MIRFETPAGQQAQVDFAHFRLPWGRRYALLVVLSYPWLLWLRLYPRQDTCAHCLRDSKKRLLNRYGDPEDLRMTAFRCTNLE